MDYRCTTGLLPYWSSGAGFSRWTSVGIHYWGLGDYWDTSWGTTEGTLLKYYSGTTSSLGHEPLLGDYRGDK